MPKSKTKNEGLLDTWGRRNRKLEDIKCLACNKLFRPSRSSSKFCSRACMWSKNGGRNKKPVIWWKNAKGYIEGKVWLSETMQIRVKQHRWVMEGILGRPLLDSEDVHHINGIKDDNSPENLEVINHGDHTSGHNSTRSYKKGYSLNLTDEEREARSMRAIQNRLSSIGRESIARAAIRKAEGEGA